MLFVKAEPGALLGNGANLDTVRKWPAQTEVTVKGVHFIQEDSADESGNAIASGWQTRVRSERNEAHGNTLSCLPMPANCEVESHSRGQLWMLSMTKTNEFWAMPQTATIVSISARPLVAS
jgi:hypothetical protein